jgi:hypothetical protein
VAKVMITYANVDESIPTDAVPIKKVLKNTNVADPQLNPNIERDISPL